MSLTKHAEYMRRYRQSKKIIKNEIHKEKRIWKPLKFGINNYFISDKGEVKNIKTGKLRKITREKNEGYLKCKIGYKGKRKFIPIHRYLALNFIPNPDKLPVVDHIDRNKINNELSNLRWASLSLNALNRDNKKIHKNLYKDGLHTQSNKYKLIKKKC